MAGDGISMPTQLAQMGSVAKTQAQAQQAAQPATNFDEQLAKKDALKSQRVKETQNAEKSHVDPDGDRRQKRKKRRRQKKLLNAEKEQEKSPEEEELGLLVDLRA